MTQSAYRLVPWTLAALLVSAFPHIFRLPLQITVIVCCILVGRLLIHKQVRKMPPQWLKLLLAGLSFIAVLATFHTINGVDAGSALLLCMVAIKTLEMNTLRDHSALLMASFFIIVSFILYDTSIWSALYLVPATGLSVFVLLKISAPDLAWKQLVPNAKFFIWYGLPLAVILFVLFPRIPGPLWGLPNSSSQAKSGLTDSMSPGTITDLVKSDALAFRAKFTNGEPQRKDLYWRGPVLHDFDGNKWSMPRVGAQRNSTANAEFANENNISYELILEPHNKRWLYVLDYARELPQKAWLMHDFQVGRTQPVTQLIRYTASSQLGDSNNAKSPNYIIERALRLPENGSRKTRELAQQWKSQNNSDRQIVNTALKHFNKELFSYTLSPQALDMSNPVDDFLFRTREGFCEHYASAFVVLMRSAGIPARVVTGYLGGERNALNGYYRITQADAHAWTEVFLKDSGWTRVDPTGAIAPERIEQSLEDTFPDANLGGFFGGSSLYLRMENSWYALNTAWFEWVLDFNAEKQMNLMEKFGFKNPDWRSLIWLLVSGVLGITLFMSLQIWRQSRILIKDPVQKIYLKFIARLNKLGYVSKKGEGPMDLSIHAGDQLPEQKNSIQKFIQAYIAIRYFENDKQPSNPRQLKELLKQIH